MESRNVIEQQCNSILMMRYGISVDNGNDIVNSFKLSAKSKNLQVEKHWDTSLIKMLNSHGGMWPPYGTPKEMEMGKEE